MRYQPRRLGAGVNVPRARIRGWYPAGVTRIGNSTQLAEAQAGELALAVKAVGQALSGPDRTKNGYPQVYAELAPAVSHFVVQKYAARQIRGSDGVAASVASGSNPRVDGHVRQEPMLFVVSSSGTVPLAPTMGRGDAPPIDRCASTRRRYAWGAHMVW